MPTLRRLIASSVSATLLVGGSALGVVTLGTAAHAATAPRCATSDLSARATGSGAGMSQPYTYIAVTNTSTASCSLKGYPEITRAWTKRGRVAIDVGHGDVYGAQDKGPKLLVLRPGGQAWFAMGTATAFDPPIRNLVRVGVAVRAGAGVGIRVAIQQAATAPKGKPIPIGVTAFAAGKGPAGMTQ